MREKTNQPKLGSVKQATGSFWGRGRTYGIRLAAVGGSTQRTVLSLLDRAEFPLTALSFALEWKSILSPPYRKLRSMQLFPRNC